MCRCRCNWDHPPTFGPLSEILPRRYTPELEYLLARFASLMPYRQVVQLLQSSHYIGLRTPDVCSLPAIDREQGRRQSGGSNARLDLWSDAEPV